MVKLAFFGHNINEPAVRKRARSFINAGITVVGVMPHRGTPTKKIIETVSLGATHDKDYLGRLKPFLKSISLTPNNHNVLRGIDLIYARNLDMLACAHAFRLRNGLNVPIVYECLDVHNLLSGNGIVASTLRKMERALLRRSDLLVYSSERFRSDYFAVHHPGQYFCRLVENRLNVMDVGPRPTVPRRPSDGVLKLGWIGNLRCRRSFDLLAELGAQFAPKIEIHLHGYLAENVFPDFEGEVASAPGLTYFGRYDSATDLSKVYNGLDAVWAGDWFEAKRNSVWQIPNRFYEGGYFGVPAIAAHGTETAHKISTMGVGWTLKEPVETNAAKLISHLLEVPREVELKSRALLDLPISIFVETPKETRALADEVLARAQRGVLG